MDAQQHVINSANPNDWDLILIQEPYLNHLSNSRANHHWVVVYPPTHAIEGSARTRSIILVNKNIPSDTYDILPIYSADVTGLRLRTQAGEFTLLNIYNSCTDNHSIEKMAEYLRSPARARQGHLSEYMFWLGDFNRHHALWEEDQNQNLRSSDDMVEPLLDLVADHDMVMALPAGIPTLEALSSGSWTRPDNVWCSSSAIDLTIKCETDPALRPPKTDHLPIVTEIDSKITRTPESNKRCFKNADWTLFREKLTEISQDTTFIREPMNSNNLNTLLDQITNTVTKAVEDSVPIVKPSPYMKRWWNKELTAARKEKQRASREAYHWRGSPTHEAHQLHRKATDTYVKLMEKAKEEKWDEFLRSGNASDIWAANRYLNGPPTDGGQTRIPPLKKGDARTRNNEETAKVLAETFFIPKPPGTLPPPPIPPKQYSPLTPYSIHRVTNKARVLKKNKAPGPDGLPNEVWTIGIDILGGHITTLFNAIMNMGYYPKRWRISTTVVLRKPGKSAYDVAKSYRPIALLNTLGKLLSGLIADDLKYICEANGLLSNRAYGGRPGRVTTDAIHLITHRVKDTWRAGRVASVLFLDIQATFPNLVRERLIFDHQEINKC